jgi:hypothetical protein
MVIERSRDGTDTNPKLILQLFGNIQSHSVPLQRISKSSFDEANRAGRCHGGKNDADEQSK